MISALIIDSDSLIQTAQALKTINPGRASVESIRRHIEQNIREGENTYISTAGWVAYTWLHPDTLQTHVKVAVEPYGVLKYLTGLPA